MLRILTATAILSVFAAIPSESQAQVIVTRPQTGFGFSLGFNNGYSFGNFSYQNFNQGYFVAPVYPGYGYGSSFGYRSNFGYRTGYGYGIPAPVYRYPTYGYGYGHPQGRPYYRIR